MTAEMTRLIYDSERSSAAVGVRAAFTAGRSLVFQGSDLTVDVTVHAGSDAWGYHYGQVIRHADGSPVVGAGVSIDGGADVETDECGQFAIASADARAAQALRIRLAGRTLTFVLPASDDHDER